MLTGTYSFLNVVANLTGPGAVALNMGSGSGVAEEGITIEASEDKNTMTIGADGAGQHSLIASDAATLTFRYLKTSATNAALQALYDLQSVSSALWGQNVITVSDTGRGDFSAFQACAFKKKPTITYAKVGEMMEWTFDCVVANSILGTGL